MSKIKEATEALLQEVDINELLAKVEQDPIVQLNDILEKICVKIQGLTDEKGLQINIDSCFLAKDLDMKAYMVGFLSGKLFKRGIIEKVFFNEENFNKGFAHGEKA